jgi:hypothetical protein
MIKAGETLIGPDIELGQDLFDRGLFQVAAGYSGGRMIGVGITH